ncbi:MAG: hypothetical protein KGD70_04320 [Candidatus Lokiarchaeota archaeon]|nr:hypothetical protein [Candidatus Lokiarchaeota archaeon]
MKKYELPILGNNINILMYSGSIFVFLSFFFPLASPKSFVQSLPPIHWIWSFSSHEALSDYSIFLYGFNIFINLLILICPIMVIMNTYLAQKRKINKEIYEKQIFTYSTTILFLTTNLLIFLPYLHIHTITVGWFTADMWGYYIPSFGLIGLFLGVAMISLGVLFSIKFTKVKLYEILIILASVSLYLVSSCYFDLANFLTSFITIILIFFVYSFIYESFSNRFIGFIIIFCVLSSLFSQDIYFSSFFLIISYFYNITSLMALYLSFLTRFFISIYLPAILFFIFLLFLYVRKKPDEELN